MQMNRKQLQWLLASLGGVVIVCSSSALSNGTDHKSTGADTFSKNGVLTHTSASPETRKRKHRQTAPAHDLVRAAEADYRSGNYSRARAKIEQALAVTAPADMWEFGPARHLLARTLIKQGLYRDALQQMEFATRSTGSERLNLDAALCLTKLGELERARAIRPSLEAAIKSIGGIPDQATSMSGGLVIASARELEAAIRLALGYDYLCAADYAVALEEFQDAHKLTPNNPVISVCLGRTLKHQKRYREALPHLEAARRGFATRLQVRTTNLNGLSGLESLDSDIALVRYKRGHRDSANLP
jgi:tetratricopeptide (TPR) repeat protein